MKIRTYKNLIVWHLKSWVGTIFKYRPTPYKLMVQLTDLCNSRCKTCHIWTKEVNSNLEVKEVTSSAIINVVKELNNDLIWISFTGGEPTLKPELVIEVIKQSKKICPKLSIVAFTTNGLLPEKALQIADTIKGLSLDCIVTISLDGDEQVHDNIRGIKGNYKLAHETMSILKHNGIVAHFGLTISKYNHDYIKNEYAHAAKNIKAITSTHMSGIYNINGDIDSSRMVESLEKVTSFYKIEKLHELIEFIYLKIAKKFYIHGAKKNIIPCSSLTSSIDILANGDVVPCMFLKKIATAHSFKISDLTTEEGLVAIENIKKNQCPKCWMNCYAPHSIMHSPLKAIKNALL